MSSRSMLLIGCLIGCGWLPGAQADLLANPPPRWQGRIASIETQRLTGLSGASAQRIGAARRGLSERLAKSLAGETDSELAEEYGRLGGLYAAANLVGASLTAFENAQRLDPKAFRWTYLTAHVALQDGAARSALEWLDKAKTLDPTYPPLQLRRADALLSLNRLAEAKAAYAAVSDPAMAAATLYGEAQIDLLERDWAAAAKKLTEVLKQQPQATAAHYSLGQALLRLGRRTEAQSHLVKRGTRKPVYPDPLVEELRALQKDARYQFEQAMQAVNNGDAAAAVDLFAAGLATDPGNAKARASYARTLWMIGQQAKALKEMRRAAVDGPEETLPPFLLSVTEEGGGNLAAAEAGYRSVLRLDPQHQGGLSYLGRLMLRQRRYAEAAEALAGAIAAGANLMPVYLHYWAALRGVQTGDAQLLRHLRSFEQRFPEPPVFRFLRAKLMATSADAAVRDVKQARQIAQQLFDATPIADHAELLALTLAVDGEFERAAQLIAQSLQHVRQGGGASGEVARLEVLLEGYRSHHLPTPLWPVDDPLLIPLPVDVQVAWRNYPAANPF